MKLRGTGSLCLAWIALTFAPLAAAQGQFVDIEPKSVNEIQFVLDTLEKTISDDLRDVPPVVMMLHGNDAHRFLRKNYGANKSLVDQAAKLAAYDVIKVQICAAWMAHNEHNADDLFPFITTVPYGAGELEQVWCLG